MGKGRGPGGFSEPPGPGPGPQASPSAPLPGWPRWGAPLPPQPPTPAPAPGTLEISRGQGRVGEAAARGSFLPAPSERFRFRFPEPAGCVCGAQTSCLARVARCPSLPGTRPPAPARGRSRREAQHPGGFSTRLLRWDFWRLGFRGLFPGGCREEILCLHRGARPGTLLPKEMGCGRFNRRLPGRHRRRGQSTRSSPSPQIQPGVAGGTSFPLHPPGPGPVTLPPAPRAAPSSSTVQRLQGAGKLVEERK